QSCYKLVEFISARPILQRHEYTASSLKSTQAEAFIRLTNEITGWITPKGLLLLLREYKVEEELLTKK
ncbi:hypothetical protein Tco_1527289, partial [Tanacetum coccineum]